MALFVLKFGGTSVASIEHLRVAAKNIQAIKLQGHEVVVVVSAMGDETDQLIEMAQTIEKQPHPREYDMLLSAGEQKTMALLAMILNATSCPAQSLTGWQAGIKTDAHHNRAKIVDIDTRKIRQVLEQGMVCIVAGFQGASEDQEITTIGRGGSDLTAVALASALKAEECRIYTDVDGVHTADPSLVPNAPKLDTITSDEMLALATLGANVLHDRAVQLAAKLMIPLRVLSSLNAGEGTLVLCPGQGECRPISGIACHEDQPGGDVRVSIVGAVVERDPAFSSYISSRLKEEAVLFNDLTINKLELSFVVTGESVAELLPYLHDLLLVSGTELHKSCVPQ